MVAKLPPKCLYFDLVVVLLSYSKQETLVRQGKIEYQIHSSTLKAPESGAFDLYPIRTYVRKGNFRSIYLQAGKSVLQYRAVR